MITLLDANSCEFPDPYHASDDMGLLAFGGDLSAERLVSAYRQGIFPWFSLQDPIMWFSPNPRALITPNQLHVSKSMARFLRQHSYDVRWNTAFAQTMSLCAAPRAGQSGTWILPCMQQAYLELHQMGVAHSIEIWHDQVQIGGLYGVCLGPFFFGESMFSHQKNASKLALISLVQRLASQGLVFLDCQIMTDHLQSLGAQAYDRALFLSWLPLELEKPEYQAVSNSVVNRYLATREC